MISRDEFLLKIRPVISKAKVTPLMSKEEVTLDIKGVTLAFEITGRIFKAKVTPLMSKEEVFQNRTIRPIALLQNDILVEVFKHYIKKHKNVFYDLSVEKRIDYIENAIHKDMKFRNSLKGIIIGQFTIAEHQDYVSNSSALNKRMMQIVKERLKSNIQLLELNFAFN